jgi:hypothetical protein
VRRAVARAAVRWVLRRADVRLSTYTRDERAEQEPPRPPSAGLGEGPIIDGEFERVDERPASQRNGPHRNNGRPTPHA